MFDQFLIRKDSLENDYADGKAVGFRFAVRIADYRGCFLSLHNGYYISVDGEEYPRDLQTFEINGKRGKAARRKSVILPCERLDLRDFGVGLCCT